MQYALLTFYQRLNKWFNAVTASTMMPMTRITPTMPISMMGRVFAQEERLNMEKPPFMRPSG